MDPCNYAELRGVDIYRTDGDLDTFFPNVDQGYERNRWAIYLRNRSFYMEHILIDGGNHGIFLEGHPMYEKSQSLTTVSYMSNMLVKNL